MSTTFELQRHTAEELLHIPDGDRYELIDGHLVEMKLGAEASWIGGRIFQRLSSFVEEHQSGWALPGDTSYQCFQADGERVRRPDASFIQTGRLPGERIPKGHIRIAPDLVVEVVSPNDLFTEVKKKVTEYLEAGVRLIWVIDPDTRTVEVIRAAGKPEWLSSADSFSGEDVLPGFELPVAQIFPPISAPSQDAAPREDSHEP